MIKIENIIKPSPAQWEAVIRGMRNPMNSWNKSDSYKTYIEDAETLATADFAFFVGDEDLKLMKNLAKAGSDHRKYLRMIPVYMDITAPFYWWKEFDTYKVGTVANSCSTMHKIHSKNVTLDDFSHEHLTMKAERCLLKIIEAINEYRNEFVCTNERRFWWQMIQLLPSSYNQRRTVMLNYETLWAMYQARKNHKLDEWKQFCDVIGDLPYFKEIFGIES